MVKLVVAGTGTAGYLSAAILKNTIPDADITILDGGSGVIGVGEGTYCSFIGTVTSRAGIDINELVSEVKPVAKFGIEFDFGKRIFHYTFGTTFDWKYNKEKKPIGFNFDGGNYGHSEYSRRMINKIGVTSIEPNHAMHLDNKRWLEFLRKHVIKQGVKIIKDTITSVERKGDNITSINNKYKADYYIDCTGFKGILTKSKWIPYKNLKNDRALFFMTKDDEPIRPYTLATTMNSGWLWQIDHMDSTSNGYVYSSKYITDEDAKKEVEDKLGVDVKGRVIKFIPGRREKIWTGNVISIGNSGGFIEPLEATSISIILHNATILSDIIHSGPNDYLIDRFNNQMNERYDVIADFISVHFIYNKKLTTPYWKDYNKLSVKKGTLADEIITYYKHNNVNIIMTTQFYDNSNPFDLEGWWSILRGLDV